MSARRLLLVDDDETFRGRLARALEARGLAVVTAPDPAAALEEARRHAPDYAVVDLKMPGGSGLDLVRELVAHAPAIRIVVLTGYGSIASAVEAMHRGAHHYLSKPADADEIIAALEGDAARAGPAARGSAGAHGHAHAGARGVGAHEPHPRRLRRQRLGSGAPPRHHEAHVAAQAEEESAAPLRLPRSPADLRKFDAFRATPARATLGPFSTEARRCCA